MAKRDCKRIRRTGDHDIWECPCGHHSTAVPRHSQISPGSIRNIGRDLACLPEGWLR